jgi:hypothetical protein
VSGTTFTLNGFRTGSAFCLAFSATGASVRSSVTCAPLAQLRAAREPAVVVNLDADVGDRRTAPTRVGPLVVTHVPRAYVTFGIVTVGVRRVEVAGHGRAVDALVAGNAFLAVVDRPAAAYETEHVWATTAGGERVAIPFVGSRLGRRTALGPAAVQRHVRGGTIGWLVRRELRGGPVPRSRWPRLMRPLAGVFAREVRPDPGSLYRFVVSIGRGTLPFANGPEALVCNSLLTHGSSGTGCAPLARLFARGPLSFSVGWLGGSQTATFSGLASDDVARIELFLADGERLRAPLADNAFFVQGSRAAFPARLVAFDRDGRVIEVKTFASGGGRSTPGSSGPRLAQGAAWRTILRAHGASVDVGRGSDDRTCFVERLPGGASRSGCLSPRWRGPDLQLVVEPGVLVGHVRPGIASVVVHLADGREQRVGVAHGSFVLAALAGPARYAVGVDARGRAVARQSFTRR